MPRHAGIDHNFLAMALIGFEAEVAKINAIIAAIRARLGKAAGASAASTRRPMSAAGRRHIAAAQRKRWAAVRKR